MTWRKTSKESVLSAKVEQERAFNRRSALWESQLTVRNVDIHQVLRTRADRQVEVNASDAELTTRGKADWSKRTVFFRW